jgi:hypothetical protein
MLSVYGIDRICRFTMLGAHVSTKKLSCYEMSV